MNLTFRNLGVFIIVLAGFFLSHCSDQKGVTPGNVDALELTPVLTIDSASLQDEEGIFFSDFARDPDGSNYLLDGDSVTVYRYDKSGQLLGSFLKKGEGPGEFLGYPRLQLTDDYLWVSGRRKVGKFTKDGVFVEEYKQKSYFSAIRVVDESRFLGTKERFFDDKNGKTESVKILGLFTLQNEKLLFTYLETGSTGRFFVPSGKMRISVIPGGGLVPDLKFGFNPAKGEVVFADTKFHKVFTMNLDGNNRSEFFFQSEKTPVPDEFKEGIIQSFGKVQEDLKKKVFEALPDYFCAIKKIRALPDNMILVESMGQGGKSVFRLFDEQGKLIRSFLIDSGFKFHALKFSGDRVGMLEDKEESSVYHEFTIELN
ncbi:MAG: hypothetical protein ABFR75_02425 [Acidobacteriota bacterium]